MPILIALGVVVIAVLAITGLRVLRGDEVRAEAGVDRAVVGQNDALQRQDYADFVGFTCVAQQGSRAAVLGEQRRPRPPRGPRSSTT